MSLCALPTHLLHCHYCVFLTISDPISSLVAVGKEANGKFKKLYILKTRITLQILYESPKVPTPYLPKIHLERCNISITVDEKPNNRPE